MNKQQSTRMASLRKKLLAAIAMLLVACIMTVSSTYAWFTLSTAPEVKGISTTIGANGNLEMALGTYETFFDSDDPGSYVGSSMFIENANVEASNITWGNLVDLSNAIYGLQNISLYPSRLQLDVAGKVNRTSPLQFPVYGADGRVSTLSKNSLVGKYDATSKGFVYNPSQTATGVSGVGSASSMSPRAFALMNAKSSMVSYQAAAQNAAKDAIRLYGGQLAAIALKYQNDNGSGVVSANDIAVLKQLIAKLQESNTAISESMKSAVLAILASTEANVLPDDVWANLAGKADGKTIVEFMDEVPADVTIYPQVDDILAEYQAIQANLDAASAVLPATGDGTWADVKVAVAGGSKQVEEETITCAGLLKADKILIGGHNVSAVKDDYKNNGMGGTIVKELFNKVSDGSLAFTFDAGSGIFSDIAGVAGEYDSSMEFPEGTEVEGLDLNMLGSKTVAVKSTNGKQGLLGVAYTGVIDGLTPPAEVAGATKNLTDTYGYVIDLLFRTNATESDLLLQTEAANRYAEGAQNTATQGNGSNITFTVNAEYSKEKIKALAEGIRVVFFDVEGNILGVAVLDTTSTPSGDAYKMGLKLLNKQVEEEVTVGEGESLTTTTVVKTAGYKIAADGQITIAADATYKTDAKLCALTANVKTGISALVYLDGDVITNEHAGVQNGLDATVNLQFASSVELKPMENADLMGEKAD